MTSGLFHHYPRFIGKDAFHCVPFLIPLNHVFNHRKSSGARIKSNIPVGRCVPALTSVLPI